MAIQPIDGGACRLETGKKKVKIVTSCKFGGKERIVGNAMNTNERDKYVDMNVLKMTGDSGATSHMTYKNELMQTYLKAAPKSHFIETANGEECEVVRYG